MLYLMLRTLLDAFLWLTAPVVFLFVPKETNRLPSMLRYYEDYNYGINGDEYWVNPGVAGHPSSDAEARSWKWRVKWSWRNANTFDHEHGLDTRTVVRVEHSGDPKTSNHPGHSGSLDIVAYDANGKQYHCRYVVKQWGTSGKCWRLYTGYKLKDLLDFWIANQTLNPELMGQKNLRRIAQRVWSPNPFMGFST